MPTAQHRPALKRRRYRHDDLVAVDLFSGFGGLTEGIRRAGFLTIMAANHNAYNSQANTKRAYAQGLSLFDLDDPEWDAAVTRSERDRERYEHWRQTDGDPRATTPDSTLTSYRTDFGEPAL